MFYLKESNAFKELGRFGMFSFFSLYPCVVLQMEIMEYHTCNTD